MKAIKILSAICVVIFLSVFQTLEVKAQGKPDNSNQSQTSTVKEPANVKQDSDENQDFKNLTANKESTNERYRIGYQDTIEVTVYRHPDLTQTMSISPDGTISMPRIDQPIVAVCKTERELKANIENLYKTYLRNPYVNVRAVDQKSQPFAVIGAVKNPGNFYLNRKIQLLGLLALAGGPDYERSGSKIRIARVGNVSSCEETPETENKDIEFVSYNLKDVQDGKQNPWMQPGDVVSVLEADEAYVVGNVFKPAKVSLKDPKTLTQAIAYAGGLDATAKTDKVVIRRQEVGSQDKTELVYDLKDIREKRIPDPQLQANDIVEVSNDRNKSIKNGLIKVLTGSIPNAIYRLPLP